MGKLDHLVDSLIESQKKGAAEEAEGSADSSAELDLALGSHGSGFESPNEEPFESEMEKAKDEKSLAGFVRMVDLIREESLRRKKDPAVQMRYLKVEKYIAQQEVQSELGRRGSLYKKAA